ncbi:MAG: carboxypeptidase regulatory-like domain-containing protein [Acidobacteria bacterium]|nr:carboxypeptidase regulatory-like domain-containing protein [Acidobacteriota bacterium]
MRRIFCAAMLTITLFGFTAYAQPANKPAVQEGPEPLRDSTPIPGIDVTLEQESGAVLKTVRTDTNGKFEFSNLKPGTYRLKTSHTVMSPRDPASGQATGKRLQASVGNAQVVSPRDVASGQATGKRTATDVSESSDTSTNSEAARVGINTSRSNIKNQRVAAEVILGDDDEPAAPVKAGVNTSRSNIRNKQAEMAQSTDDVITVQLVNEQVPNSKRTFMLPHVLEKSGFIVQVDNSGTLSGNILKTRHDTVKNSINNVR